MRSRGRGERAHVPRLPVDESCPGLKNRGKRTIKPSGDRGAGKPGTSEAKQFAATPRRSFPDDEHALLIGDTDELAYGNNFAPRAKRKGRDWQHVANASIVSDWRNGWLPGRPRPAQLSATLKALTSKSNLTNRHGPTACGRFPSVGHRSVAKCG